MKARTAAIMGALLVALLGGVVGGALELVASDRAKLNQKFAAERLNLTQEAAELSRSDLDRVDVMLQVTDTVLQGTSEAGGRNRELQALLASSPEFRALRVFDANGDVLVPTIWNPRLDALPNLELLEHELEAPAMQLRARPGELDLSRSIHIDKSHSLRVYAYAPPLEAKSPASVIAVLVESERLFSKLSVLSADPAVTVLFLGPHGLPTPSSDARLAAAVNAKDPSRQLVFGEVVHAMREGGEGTRWLSTSEAAALGLGDADVLVAFAPLATHGLGKWSLAIFTSTSVLSAAQQSIAQRLAAAAAIIATLLVAFAVFVVMSSRRAAVSRERLLHAERLARLHERTEKTLDNIPAGVMSLDASKRLTSANRVVRERLSPQLTLPSSLEQALPGAPASTVRRLEQLIDDAVAAREVRSFHGERLALFGSEGQYSVHAVPLGETFDEARSLLVIEDVSEVRSLESQLLRAEKLATIGVLAAGLAHEIGTPLGVVRSRAEYVLSKLGGEHPQARGVQVIVDQIDRVTRTVRQMLDFSRVQPAAVRPVMLKQVTSWLSDVLQYEAQRRQLKFEVRLPAQLPLVSADPDQLQQLLLNLTMNACDACRAGGNVTLSAEPSASTAGWPCVRIDVTDDGHGISEEHRQGIFDPFFTTKKRGQGTGLGLTVAAQIARNHGAQIELDSAVGRGTRVMVFWPLAPSSPTEQRTHDA